jgi:hypothetical protein
VTGVARLIDGNAVVLEVSCGDMVGIVNVKTLPVRLHNMARKAKDCLFRSLKMLGRAPGPAKNRQDKESDKRENFPASRHCDRWPRQNREKQDDRASQENIEDPKGSGHEWYLRSRHNPEAANL